MMWWRDRRWRQVADAATDPATARLTLAAAANDLASGAPVDGVRALAVQAASAPEVVAAFDRAGDRKSYAPWAAACVDAFDRTVSALSASGVPQPVAVRRASAAFGLPSVDPRFVKSAADLTLSDSDVAALADAALAEQLAPYMTVGVSKQQRRYFKRHEHPRDPVTGRFVDKPDDEIEVVRRNGGAYAYAGAVQNEFDPEEEERPEVARLSREERAQAVDAERLRVAMARQAKARAQRGNRAERRAVRARQAEQSARQAGEGVRREVVSPEAAARATSARESSASRLRDNKRRKNARDAARNAVDGGPLPDIVDPDNDPLVDVLDNVKTENLAIINQYQKWATVQRHNNPVSNVMDGSSGMLPVVQLVGQGTDPTTVGYLISDPDGKIERYSANSILRHVLYGENIHAGKFKALTDYNNALLKAGKAEDAHTFALDDVGPVEDYFQEKEDWNEMHADQWAGYLSSLKAGLDANNEGRSKAESVLPSSDLADVILPIQVMLGEKQKTMYVSMSALLSKTDSLASLLGPSHTSRWSPKDSAMAPFGSRTWYDPQWQGAFVHDAENLIKPLTSTSNNLFNKSTLVPFYSKTANQSGETDEHSRRKVEVSQDQYQVVGFYAPFVDGWAPGTTTAQAPMPIIVNADPSRRTESERLLVDSLTTRGYVNPQFAPWELFGERIYDGGWRHIQVQQPDGPQPGQGRRAHNHDRARDAAQMPQASPESGGTSRAPGPQVRQNVSTAPVESGPLPDYSGEAERTRRLRQADMDEYPRLLGETSKSDDDFDERKVNRDRATGRFTFKTAPTPDPDDESAARREAYRRRQLAHSKSRQARMARSQRADRAMRAAETVRTADAGTSAGPALVLTNDDAASMLLARLRENKLRLERKQAAESASRSRTASDKSKPRAATATSSVKPSGGTYGPTSSVLFAPEGRRWGDVNQVFQGAVSNNTSADYASVSAERVADALDNTGYDDDLDAVSAEIREMVDNNPGKELVKVYAIGRDEMPSEFAVVPREGDGLDEVSDKLKYTVLFTAKAMGDLIDLVAGADDLSGMRVTFAGSGTATDPIDDVDLVDASDEALPLADRRRADWSDYD